MATHNPSSWPTQRLLVASLDLDQKNPRLGGLAANSSPREITHYLFQHDKAMDVAESIASRGYFPNEPLLAIRNGKRYTIIEGNRRLAALMALREPSILTGTANRQVERLSKRIARDELLRVPVTIAPDRKATDRQVAGRHVGSPVRAWTADNRARFILEKLDEGYSTEELLDDLGFSFGDVRSARETRAIVGMARSLDLPEDVKTKIDSPRTKVVSTLERLFDSTVGREIMHVERDPEHGYRVTTTQREFIPFFQKLVTKVANNEISTRTLNDNKLIRAHFEKEWSQKDLPKKKSGSFLPSDLAGSDKPKSKTSLPKVTVRDAPAFKTVLPKTLKVAYGATRLRIIKDELVSLDREKKSNAGAVLLRVFFELCVSDYLIRTGRMASLEARLKAKGKRWRYDHPDMQDQLNEIRDVANKNLSKQDADRVAKAIANNPALPFSVPDLHSFVHDTANLPTGNEILQFWLRTEKLFRLMLESDPSTHK